jgi:predicted ribosome quality control (RQC) complex YloA/Tae2 family protein
MHFDALTLACVTHELQTELTGGRIQQMVLPHEAAVGLEIYAQRRRRYLLLNAQPGDGRVHLVADKLRRGVEQETPLLLLLRKYVRESILDAIVQPDPTERILHLVCDHAAHGVTTLIVEPMGRLSNLFLVSRSGTILECVHRVRPGEHAQRVLLPGKPYTPPPHQDRLPPWDDGSEDYYTRLQALAARPGKLWRAIAEGIAGASPTLAREAAWRAAGDSEAPAAAVTLPALAQALQELWAPLADGGWSPGVIEDTGRVIGYSAYPLHYRPGFAPRPSISQALEAAHAAQSSADAPQTAERHDGYAGLRAQAAAQVARARRRVERQLAALAQDLPDPQQAARLRREAEWLLALAHQVTPGQTVLEVDTGEDSPLRIALDPVLPAVEQAQRRFKQAGKLDRAAAFVPQRRAQVEQDLAYLDQLATDLALAENQPQIAAVEAELMATKLLPPRPGRAKPAPPRTPYLRVHSPAGWEIAVGRNARQNDQVTFQVANADDLWLHARGIPGAHVVIRSGGQPVDEATLQMAAQLAAYYSQRRGDRAVPVAVTTRRFVTRVPGGHPGQVYLRKAETLSVPAELPDEVIRE